jgi:hypothetical protein
MVALCWLGNVEPALDEMLSEDIVLALLATSAARRQKQCLTFWRASRVHDL